MESIAPSKPQEQAFAGALQGGGEIKSSIWEDLRKHRRVSGAKSIFKSLRIFLLGRKGESPYGNTRQRVSGSGIPRLSQKVLAARAREVDPIGWKHPLPSNLQVALGPRPSTCKKDRPPMGGEGNRS